MDTTRPRNRTLQECIAISNFSLQMLNSCSRCVGEFGDAEQGICHVLYAHKRFPHQTKIISPQSLGSTAYWLRNKRNGGSGLSKWCSHPPDRNQSGHSFGSTYHFGLKFGLNVRNGSYSIVEIQREEIIHSKVLQLAYGQVPSVARFLVTNSRAV